MAAGCCPAAAASHRQGAGRGRRRPGRAQARGLGWMLLLTPHRVTAPAPAPGHLPRPQAAGGGRGRGRVWRLGWAGGGAGARLAGGCQLTGPLLIFQPPSILHPLVARCGLPCAWRGVAVPSTPDSTSTSCQTSVHSGHSEAGALPPPTPVTGAPPHPLPHPRTLHTHEWSANRNYIKMMTF